MVCEGTNVKRSDAALQSEHDLQKQLEAGFWQHKFNIVYLSSNKYRPFILKYHHYITIGNSASLLIRIKTDNGCSGQQRPYLGRVKSL